MSKTLDLTQDDVLHIAKLANIPLTDAEVEKYQKQLIETINYVENLDELDTTDIEPTSHSTKVTNVYFKDGTRSDRTLSQEEALMNGKKTKKKMFVVERIMGD